VVGPWIRGNVERKEVGGGHPPRFCLGRVWSTLPGALADELTEPGDLPSITALSIIRRWDSLSECWRLIIKSEFSTRNRIAVVSHWHLKVASICGHIGERVEEEERNPLTGGSSPRERRLDSSYWRHVVSPERWRLPMSRLTSNNGHDKCDQAMMHVQNQPGSSFLEQKTTQALGVASRAYIFV